MRLVDFLIHLLEAHAQTLQRLAALFGEDYLVQIFESMDDEDEARIQFKFNPSWIDPTRSTGSASVYAELESAVHELKLSARLEFYLWAYPHYRAFIESPLDLSSRIQGPGHDAGSALVEEAVSQAADWIRRLPLPPEQGAQAERAAHVPWLRFRTAVLKRIGKRPIGPVY